MNLFKKTFIALLGIALAGGAFVTTALTNPINSNELTKVKAAEEVTINLTNIYENGTDIPSGGHTDEQSGININVVQGEGDNPPKFYSNSLRIYTSNVVTITSTLSKNITNISFETSDGNPSTFYIQSSSSGDAINNNGVITSEAGFTELVFINSGVQVRITSMTVTFINQLPEVEITDITLSGDMTKKEYYDNESWDTTGLIVKGNDGTVDINAKDITWTFTPEVPALGVTSVEVVANYNELSSNPLTIEGITVSEAPNLISDTLKIDD